MDISTTLLVILMFTSIVGIGIANILMAFAGQVSALSQVFKRWVWAAWLLILLLTYLGMFWNSRVLVQREDWHYSLFLFVILGPILLLFASTVMTQRLVTDADDGESPRDDKATSRFFCLYAAVQAWFIGMDYVVGTGWFEATTVSVCLFVAASLLAVIRKHSLIRAFTYVMLGLTVVDLALFK